MVIWIHEATVVTKMAFPTDMLRYDSCYPADQDSVLEMTASCSREDRVNRKLDASLKAEETGRKAKDLLVPYRINIRKRGISKDDGFTEGRWSSFSCKLENVKVFKR